MERAFHFYLSSSLALTLAMTAIPYQARAQYDAPIPPREAEISQPLDEQTNAPRIWKNEGVAMATKQPSFVSMSEMAGNAETIFEGLLTAAEVVAGTGGKVLYTLYTFQVEQAIKGEPGATVTRKMLGGRKADGTMMDTALSLKLTPGERYLVFLKPGSATKVNPFGRVLQIHGDVLASEGGREIVGVSAEGFPRYSRERRFEPLTFTKSMDLPPVPQMAAPVSHMRGTSASSDSEQEVRMVGMARGEFAELLRKEVAR
jgi:hypothetical protein